MVRQVILIEGEQKNFGNIIPALKNSLDFEIAAVYRTAYAALGQSRMFNPDLFLIDVEDAKNITIIPEFVELYRDSMIIGLLDFWDSEKNFDCIEAGAAGCILKTFKLEEIRKSLELYKLRGKNSPSRIISFFSPKGRAGRTTTASILALTIAEKSGERVALIDADLQFGDMAVFFDIEPEHTLIEVSQDIKLLNPLTFDPYFYKLRENVSLLAAPNKPEYAELVEVKSLVEIVHLACALFRYVLIDLPIGFNPVTIGMYDLAEINVVMTMMNKISDIHHMRRAIEMFQTLDRVKQLYTCFTRVEPCNDDERLKIQRELGYPVTDILPNGYHINSIINRGKLLKALPKDSRLVQKIEQIADDLIQNRR